MCKNAFRTSFILSLAYLMIRTYKPDDVVGVELPTGLSRNALMERISFASRILGIRFIIASVSASSGVVTEGLEIP